MSEHWKLHECKNLPSVGIRIVYSMDNINRKVRTWRLVIHRGATEEDLEKNHILEEEGQTIWETRLEIIHCPFCGENLYKDQDLNFKDFGKFVHFDYSEWKYKMM